MPGLGRWWVYQRERFPLVRTGLLVAAFGYSAVAFSSYLRGVFGVPALPSIATAFVTSFGFFALLRIADEHKDFEEDSLYRAYRPVPRGLVTLSELRAIAIVIVVVQLGLALLLAPRLALLLAVTWAYLGLMTKEFFVRDWLKAHPLAYLFSHMLIMPFVDLYATACDWMPALGRAPQGLAWFLAMSFFNGIVIEIGRKLRAPEDEETGVETYTFLYGRPRAVAGWLLAMAAAGGSATAAGFVVGAGVPLAVVLSTLFAVVLLLSARFLARPASATSKLLDSAAGVWVLVSYASLALLPLLVTR